MHRLADDAAEIAFELAELDLLTQSGAEALQRALRVVAARRHGADTVSAPFDSSITNTQTSSLCVTGAVSPISDTLSPSPPR